MMKLWVPILLTGLLSARAAEYHVATNGSDLGPGSAAAPWRTIQKAADNLSPGDVVKVHGGVYSEAVTVRVSGSEAGGPIVFTAAEGEHPVLDGSSLVPPSNQNTGLFLLDGRSHLRIEGFEIRNYAAVSGKKVPCGIHVRGASHHVEIIGNNIHDIAYHSATHGAFGIVIYGNSTSAIHHVVIDRNEVHHLSTGYSESISVNGNVTDFAITRNRVHDNTNIGIDLAGFYGTAPAPELDQARNGHCTSNVVWNIDSSTNPAYGATDDDGDGVYGGGENAAGGIYCDGSRDVVLAGNVLHHNDIGLELGSESTSGSVTGVIVRDNFVFQNRIGGLYLGGFAADLGRTEHCQVVRNTFFSNDTMETASGELLFNFNASTNTISGNIFSAGAQNLLVTCPRTGNGGNTFDNNLYDAPAGPADSLWQWNDVLVTGFSAWKTAVGADLHSRFESPRFRSTAIPDLHLQISSPAVNAMDPATSPFPDERDIDGGPRRTGPALDLGADELTAYDAWRVAWFGDQAGNDLISGLNADPDADHLRNIEEYLYATNPKVFSSERFTISGMTASSAQIRYRRSVTAPDLVCDLQWSPNLSDWFDPDPLHLLRLDVFPAGAEYDWVQADYSFPDTEIRQYYRLVLTIKP